MNNYIKRLTKRTNILVIGDIMVDVFSFCESRKKSQEVNIPVLNIKQQKDILGGAANVWNNLIGLKSNAILCGAIGNDKYGNFVLNNINQPNLLIKNKKTTIKHRYYLNNTQVFRVDSDIISHHTKKTYDKLFLEIKKKSIDAICISDYLKGFCNDYFIKKIISYAKENKIFVAVDTKLKDINKFNNVDLLKINKHEFVGIFNNEFNLNNINEIRNFLIKHNISKLLVTLGEDGMVFIDQNNLIKRNANIVKNADVIGAGDCVISSYLIANLNNFNDNECLDFAGKCAEYCVNKIGTKNFNIDEYIGEKNE